MNNGAWAFNVYLPPTYAASTKRYPVIYSLHGGGGNEESNVFQAKEFLHNYILSGQIPEVIVVFPNGGPDNFYLNNGVIRGQSQNPDTHIIKELIPYVDAQFRTVADRKARAITGFSMGGYGAYHFGFKYPDLFGAVGPMAAGGPYGPGGLITNYSAAERPHDLAVANAARIRGFVRIRMTVGGNDLVDYNNEFSRILGAQNIPFEYEVLPGVGHDFGAIMRQSGLKIFQYLTAEFPR